MQNNSILNFGAPAIINMTTSNSKNSKSKSNKTSGSGPPKKVSSNVSGENTKKHGQKPSQVIFATQDQTKAEMYQKANQIRQHNVQNPSKNIYKSFDFVN